MAANPARVQPGAPIASTWGNAMRERERMIFANQAELTSQWTDPIDGSHAWSTLGQDEWSLVGGTFIPTNRPKMWTLSTSAAGDFFSGGNLYSMGTFTTREEPSTSLQVAGSAYVQCGGGAATAATLFWRVDGTSAASTYYTGFTITPGIIIQVPLFAFFAGIAPGTHTLYLSGSSQTGYCTAGGRSASVYVVRNAPHG